MSITRTSTVRSALDHFEPEANDDPQAQRRLRGWLEGIDYTAFAANREAISRTLGKLPAARLQRLAAAAAQARARWAAEALALADAGLSPDPATVRRLGELRLAYQELTEAYEALRRLVERGYVAYEAGA